MKHLTYEEILEKMHRIANGSDINDLDTLPAQLNYLAREAELFKKEDSLLANP